MEQVASFYDEMWQRESEYTRNGVEAGLEVVSLGGIR